MLEPTRGENALDIVLSSQNELVDNVKIHEPMIIINDNMVDFLVRHKFISTWIPKSKVMLNKYVVF